MAEVAVPEPEVDKENEESLIALTTHFAQVALSMSSADIHWWSLNFIARALSKLHSHAYYYLL